MSAPLPYDPVKRHLYYLENRKLKPKAKAATFASAGRQTARFTTAPGGHKQPVVKSNHADTKAATEKRVRELKARLTQLKTVLEQLVNQAKARSGVDPKKDATNKSAKGDGKAPAGDAKPKTASEKDKAAKAAKDYYDKTHPEAALQEQIKAVQKRIDAARKKLEDAVDTARGKAAVQFVSKRPTG